MRSKKALSPLMATVLLVAFALIIGTATMSWGKNYVEQIPEKDTYESSIVINMNQVDNPLKELQIKYITGKLNLDEYLIGEEAVLETIKS